MRVYGYLYIEDGGVSTRVRKGMDKIKRERRGTKRMAWLGCCCGCVTMVRDQARKVYACFCVFFFCYVLEKEE